MRKNGIQVSEYLPELYLQQLFYPAAAAKQQGADQHKTGGRIQNRIPYRIQQPSEIQTVRR